MSGKTPRELLQETLQQSREEVAAWPTWMRSAISTANVFRVPLSGEKDHELAHQLRGEANRALDPL